MEKKFVTGTKASKITGLHINTLRRHGDSVTIEMIKSPGGVRRYNVSQYVKDNINKDEQDVKIKVCYCRVSTSHQVDDLDRQVEYMKEKYPDFELITDEGSGINFERKGLQKIIDYAISGVLDTLAVSYKDRLCRIGYSLIEYILTKYSNTKIIIEAEKPETVNKEIANDLMQIITVYTAKMNGMISYKREKI